MGHVLEIVDKLREAADEFDFDEYSGDFYSPSSAALLREAADQIDRLCVALELAAGAKIHQRPNIQNGEG